MELHDARHAGKVLGVLRNITAEDDDQVGSGFVVFADDRVAQPSLVECRHGKRPAAAESQQRAQPAAQLRNRNRGDARCVRDHASNIGEIGSPVRETEDVHFVPL